MTKIYIYCLFEDGDVLAGVYSSLKSAHRDALKLCNRGGSGVYINYQGKSLRPELRLLRNIFKGEFDLKLDYFSQNSKVTILKTKLKD
tara:strand:+ start:6411 stop:6674 length:264 start_codon:yes stop_codon:yes gene_type:complete